MKKRNKRRGLGARPEATTNQGGSRGGAARHGALRVVGSQRSAGAAEDFEFYEIIPAEDFEFDEIIDDEDGLGDGDDWDFEHRLRAAAADVMETIFDGGCRQSRELLNDVLLAACVALAKGEAEALSRYVEGFMHEVLCEDCEDEDDTAEDAHGEDNLHFVDEEEWDDLDRLVDEAVRLLAPQMPNGSSKFVRVFLHKSLRTMCIAAITEDHDRFALWQVEYIDDALDRGVFPS